MDKECQDIIASCNTARETLNKQIAATFTGIPVVVDPNLKGNRYEIHVSKELYMRIQDEQQAAP